MTEHADWRDNDFQPILRSDLLVRSYGTEALAWSPVAASPGYLDPVSSIVLQIIDGHATVHDLVTDIHEVVGVERDLASAQVARALDLLYSCGALSGAHPRPLSGVTTEMFREPTSDRLVEKVRRSEMHALDLDIDGTRVRVACEERESYTALRRILKEYVSSAEAPLGFVLTSSSSSQRWFELSDRSDRLLGRTRERDEAHAMLASHLASLLRPKAGTVRLHARALVGVDRAATLLCWPLLAPRVVEARLEKSGHRIVDRLWVDVDPHSGVLRCIEAPWRRRLPSREGLGHLSQVGNFGTLRGLLIPGEAADALPSKAQVVNLIASIMIDAEDHAAAVDAAESLAEMTLWSVVEPDDPDAVYNVLVSSDNLAKPERESNNDTGVIAPRASTSKTIRDSYDELSYGFAAFRRTHPAELSTTAELQGLSTAPLHSCRVLELGCAEGGNLLPMAEAYPGSEFVGVDLSGRQIERGLEWTRSSGISNVELIQLDIMDVGARFGLFDYIICHGVYSWVPPQVQGKILEICRDNAARAGVSYVSYNTYPRWHLKGVLRKLMLEAVHSESPLIDQVADARSILGRLVDDLSLDSPYSAALSQEATWVLGTPDFYLAHEYLAEVNEPLYFGEFVERTSAGGLLHLGDHVVLAQSYHRGSAVMDVDPGGLRPQEYNDVVSNAGFRAAVLCRADAQLEPHRVAGRLGDFQVAASSAETTDSSEPEAGGPSSEGEPAAEVASASQFMVQVLRYLQKQYPESCGVDLLLDDLVGDSESPNLQGGNSRSDLVFELLENHVPLGVGRMELRRRPYEFVSHVSLRPTVSPLARRQARIDSSATNRRHESFTIEDPFMHLLIQLLDGTRTVVDLVRDLARSKQPFRAKDGKRIEVSRLEVEERLDQLRRNAMLIG